MPIPRLRIEETAVIVIDVQERLMPTIVDGERVARNCAILLEMAQELGMPYLVTEQYPRGLGRTVDTVSAVMADASRRVEKTRFSAAVDLVTSQLEAWRRPTVLLGGVEAHVCVLQSVLDFHATGRQCFVCSDAISASQREQIPHAISRMQRSGAVVTGVLSAIYELLGDATHPGFKPCLDLAKQVAP